MEGQKIKMLPLGLLCIIAALTIGHYVTLADFVDGFLKGLGAMLVVSGLVLERPRVKLAKVPEKKQTPLNEQ